jgi:peptidoglycan/xylan/chitin deacetylase (PgdA/CDA1 family)
VSLPNALIVVLVLLAVSVAAIYWGVRLASVSFVRNRLHGVLLSRVETDQPLVALTFDDGPDPDTTERFIEALGDARATFFVLGMNVRRWPHLARAMAAAGHELASHGDSHRTMTRVPPRGTLRELRQTQRTIVESTGVTPRFYRPPYGRFNLASWLETPRLGMRRTLWTAGARDWEAEATSELIAERILAAAAPGAILLLHDSDGDPGAPEHTLAALPAILAGFRDRGLRSVTLSELVASGLSRRRSSAPPA